MKNSLITILVTAVVLFVGLLFIRYFWWLILLAAGYYFWQYHKMKKSLDTAREQMTEQLSEAPVNGKVFANGNHDIIEAENTVHEEEGNTHAH